MMGDDGCVKAEQRPARLPDTSGCSEARRRLAALRHLRRRCTGRAGDGAAAADVVDRRRPGSGRRRSPSWPGTTGSSPSTAAAAGVVQPTARRRRLRRSRIRRRRARGARRHGHRTRPCWSGFSCGANWAVHVAADHPERVRGRRGDRAGVRARDQPHRRGTQPLGNRTARVAGGLADLQPGLLAGRARRRVPGVLLHRDVPGTALHQADRGRSRVVRGDRRGDARRHHRGAPGRRRDGARDPRRIRRPRPLPGRGDPRHR